MNGGNQGERSAQTTDPQQTTPNNSLEKKYRHSHRSNHLDLKSPHGFATGRVTSERLSRHATLGQQTIAIAAGPHIDAEDAKRLVKGTRA